MTTDSEEFPRRGGSAPGVEDVEELEQRAAEAAMGISEAFAQAGEAIQDALGSAAEYGQFAFDDLARKILTTFADLAIDKLIERPLAALFDATTSSLPAFGTRANGGPVTPGGAYLVGERGPELFRPTTAGDVSPAPGAAVNVHFHLGSSADVRELKKSEGQIAAMVARAVARGRRNL